MGAPPLIGGNGVMLRADLRLAKPPGTLFSVLLLTAVIAIGFIAVMEGDRLSK